MANGKTQTASLPPEMATLVRAAISEGVAAGMQALREADEARALQAAEAQVLADKEREEREAGRPPRVTNVPLAAIDELEGQIRPGSTVRVKCHRRMRARFWRDNDDRTAPVECRGLQPDEEVDLPISQPNQSDGQTAREVAFYVASGMLELDPAAA